MLRSTRVRKTVLPLSGKIKVNCVILSVARVDNPAKNLECYFRVEILRKSIREDRLRMTELLLVRRFFVNPSRRQVKGVQNDNRGVCKKFFDGGSKPPPYGVHTAINCIHKI